MSDTSSESDTTGQEIDMPIRDLLEEYYAQQFDQDIMFTRQNKFDCLSEDKNDKNDKKDN